MLLLYSMHLKLLSSQAQIKLFGTYKKRVYAQLTHHSSAADTARYTNQPLHYPFICFNSTLV